MGKQKRQRPDNPYEHATGLFGRLNRVLYPIAGPPPLGAGHAEEPYVAPANPVCPICGKPMSDHVVERRGGNSSTSLICPV